MKTPGDWRKRIHPDDRAAYDAAIVAHFRKKTRRFECDYRFRATDGTWRWARQRGIAVRDARGRAVQIRSDSAMAATPIVAITSFALSGDEQKAKEAGASAYLAKPYSPRDLLGLIRKFLPES